MHPSEERTTDAGDLVHNEENHRAPLFLEASCSIAFEFFFPCPATRNAEAGATCFSPEANIEGCDARVGSELDSGIDVLRLEKEPHMLHDGLQRRRFATPRGAT